MIKIKTIEDVVNYQLCSGCGMCEALEPKRYKMTDVENFGYRPEIINTQEVSTGDAFNVCPGHKLEHQYDRGNPQLEKELEDCWGPVYEVWEGYAADDNIRFKGSSGGAATALALFGIDEGYGKTVYHTGSDSQQPYKNESKKSMTKENLIKHAGSRYSPASPCAPLKDIHDEKDNVIFVGKPCDITAVSNWQKISKENQEKIAIKIGFFCAGAPSTNGNVELLKQNGVDDLDRIEKLKFRGEGWPGMWQILFTDAQSNKKTVELTYKESWGFLQRFRQWRCYVCPDHSAEFADIAVGDPWYQKVESGAVGKSLIVVRTQKGLDYLRAAQEKGYVVLEKKDNNLLPLSQPNLIKARGDIWGRLLALRMFGAPVPKYTGFVFFKFWVSSLNIKAKISSIYGTMTRVGRKKLNKNQHII